MPQATGLVAELEAALGKSKVACQLIGGSGGVFDVVVDGNRVYSKKETGRFPQYREIVGLIEQHIINS